MWGCVCVDSWHISWVQSTLHADGLSNRISIPNCSRNHFEVRFVAGRNDERDPKHQRSDRSVDVDHGIHPSPKP